MLDYDIAACIRGGVDYFLLRSTTLGPGCQGMLTACDGGALDDNSRGCALAPILPTSKTALSSAR